MIYNVLGKWQINKVFKVEPPEPLKEGEIAPNLGELYVQVKFTKRYQTEEDKNEPPLIEDLKAKLAEEQAPIEGLLLVNINHAKNIYPNDGKTSDPYVKMLLPGDAKIETPHLNKTLTPIWKFKGSSKISLPKNVKLVWNVLTNLNSVLQT